MTLVEVQGVVAEHMLAIQGCFKTGVKVTVIVRTPDYPNRDFMMTNDDMSELQELLVRRKASAEAAP